MSCEIQPARHNHQHYTKKKHCRTLFALFFGRAGDQMGQKCQYFAQYDQKCHFWAKNPNFNGRKQKFWYPRNGKTTLAPCLLCFLVRHGTLFLFRQNEIIWRGKKCTALFQTYNWEQSSFFNAFVRVFAQMYANTCQEGHICLPPLGQIGLKSDHFSWQKTNRTLLSSDKQTDRQTF